MLVDKKEFNPPGSDKEEINSAIFMSSSGGEYPVIINGKPASSSIQFSPRGTLALFKTEDGKIALVDTTQDRPGAVNLLPTPESVTLPQDFPIENLRGTQAKLSNFTVTGFGTISDSNPFAGESRRKIIGQAELSLVSANGQLVGTLQQVLSWTQTGQSGQYELDPFIKPMPGISESGKSAQIFPSFSSSSISNPKYGEITFYSGSLKVSTDGQFVGAGGILFSMDGGKTYGDLSKVLATTGLVTEKFRGLSAAGQVGTDMIFVANGESYKSHVIRKNAENFWQEARRAVGLTPIP